MFQPALPHQPLLEVPAVSHRSLSMTDRIYDYMLEVSLREPEPLARLRAETAKLDEAEMQISPEQGQFMAFLVETMGAKRALEVGVFTGYSTARVALALPADGELVACDMAEDWVNVGRKYWSELGVADRIDVRLGDATATLDTLIEREGRAGSFDFAFIDADKKRYDEYYERALVLLRPGGVVAFDNVLWGGKVADPGQTRNNTKALRALNLKLRDDARITLSMLPVGDGLTLARKR